ncbi:MAG: aminotransferase class I/II-fold pyridoxal phosphate-dependent enzyme [Gaiellaceae bacterium]
MKRPARLDRLPEHYFMHLLARVQDAAARGAEPLVDLGRGNPDLPPPPHVVEALVGSARISTPAVHGYAPFAGLAELRVGIAERYATHYGVTLDPEREVAVIPGTKSALSELVLCLAERGDTVLLPDPYYPDYPSGVALAGAKQELLPLDPERGYQPRFDLRSRGSAAAVFLNYPSNPTAACVAAGTFADAIAFAHDSGATVIHDFAYGDLVFDGRAPRSFLAEPGARDVGVELFSMSKTYGMAGWRLGFVLGNAELVERIQTLQDHVRAGIFVAVQRAGIAALTGPQDTVAERRDLYERRRDRVLSAIGAHAAPCEGTFYVWLRLPDGLTAERLLDECRVAVAPGEGFGPSGAGWARISLATPDDQLDAGLERLRLVL